MTEVKQINIKNRTYYFYDDMIHIKSFEQNFLKTDRESYKDIGIYNIGYIAITKNWWLWNFLQRDSFVIAC